MRYIRREPPPSIAEANDILVFVSYWHQNMAKGDSLGELEQLVMVAILRLGDNAYGAAIRQELEARAGRVVTGGSVYSTLQRLEEKGYVSSKLGEPLPERGGRARTYFKVEAEGLEALKHTYGALKRMAAGLKVLPQLN